MKNTFQKLIIISFLIAILVSASFYVYLKSLDNSKEILDYTTILVAANTIPPNTLIEKSMITDTEVVSNQMFDNYLQDKTDIIGEYTKETILKDEGFRKEKFIQDEDGTISVKLKENERAVSVNISSESGVSKLIKPGDYVDVIVYLSEKVENQVIVRPDITKTILQNIKILAIDKDVSAQDNENIDEEIPSNFLVTLAIKTDYIEKIVLSESIGSITLALRSIESDDADTTDGVVWQELTVDAPETDKLNSSLNEEKDQSEKENNLDFTYYTVKRGDTLRKISGDIYGNDSNYKMIMEANNIANENLIITGQVIKIPKLN
ncbi:MAG: Flp pilus assembly protein CpaB [Clostridiaceae bacterium]